MNSVLQEFEKRENEIKLYIDFITFLESDNQIYSIVNNEGISKTELRRIFLSNTYLLMYNLVESTIRNSIQEIYDHFIANNITFDLLKNEIRKTILGGFKRKNPHKIMDQIQNIASDIITISFDPDKISDGNIDALKIREIAKKYCFSDSTDYSKCKNGEKLLEIKNKRNNLAHGIVSFSECGRDISISDLKIAFKETSAYLEGLLNNIGDYLSTEAYLVPQIESA